MDVWNVLVTIYPRHHHHHHHHHNHFLLAGGSPVLGDLTMCVYGYVCSVILFGNVFHTRSSTNQLGTNSCTMHVMWCAY